MSVDRKRPVHSDSSTSATEVTDNMTDVRYDRQVRLWGDDGQCAIEQTDVCLLGATAVGSEILKCLVLAGVNSFCIIDDAVVTHSDLGNNFFLEESDLGKSRAAAELRLLQELNPSVRGTWMERSPSSLEHSHLASLLTYSVVVASNLSESHAAPISAYLYEKGVPFIHARVYGLLGCLRVCVKEHTIVNTHDENPPPDLRIDVPFAALTELIESKDISQMSDEQVRHTPYALLFCFALKRYRDALGDQSVYPKTPAERKKFLPFVMKLAREKESGGIDENFEQARTALPRSMLPTTVPPRVQRVLADEKCEPGKAASPFWILCTAIRHFVQRHGVLPLCGQLPDMASDSLSYAHIVSVYHKKAQADAMEVYEEVQKIQKKRAETGEANKEREIEKEAVIRFCRNAAFIDVQRGSSLASQQADNFYSIIERILTEDEEEQKKRCTAAIWLLLLRAVDRFKDENSRYPSARVATDEHNLRLKATAIVAETLGRTKEKRAELGEADEVSVEDVIKRVSDAAIHEMCRYRASELHVMAALLGGIAAQEVIKLATKKNIPINNTLIFDGHSQLSHTFML